MEMFGHKDKAEYYHRCYKAADGLWFVKTEERYDFDTALEIDLEVWKVMPKIQARFIKEKLETGEGLEALALCFSQKLELDGFVFQTERHLKDGRLTVLQFHISTCPWHDILIRSGREHLSHKIGGVICSIEYGVWASEFGKDIDFSFGDNRICGGDVSCVLNFSPGQDKK